VFHAFAGMAGLICAGTRSALMILFAPPPLSRKLVASQPAQQLHSVSGAEAVIAREHDRLCTRPNPQLVENVGCVIADCLFADAKAIGDVDVAQAIGH